MSADRCTPRFAGLLVATLAVACGGGGGGEDPAAWAASVNRIASEAGSLQPLAADKNVVEQLGEQRRDANYKYVAEKHDVVDNIQSITYLGLNDNLIWPGSLIRGARAHDFIYDPIIVDRAPITLSISLEGSSCAGSSLVQTVADPKLSTIRDGIKKLMQGSGITTCDALPAKAEFSYVQVASEQHLDAYVGAKVSYGAGSLDTKFNWSSTTKKNKILAKYRQIYYSIDVDPPRSPAAVVAQGTPLDQVAAALPPGSMPLYVSSVSYGFMALVFIETDYTQEVIDVALTAAYGGASLSAELDAGLTLQDVMEQSSIQVVVYGGSTAGLDQSLYTGLAGFQAVVQASKRFGPDSPGVPLVYKFSHLVDNTLALVTLTSQYTLVRPIPILMLLRVRATDWYCQMADDEGADDTIDMDPLWLKVTVYGRTAPTAAEVLLFPQALVQQTSGVAMDSGTRVPAGGAVTIPIDIDTYDLESTRLVLDAYAQDLDSPGFPLYNDHDVASGAMTLFGSEVFEDACDASAACTGAGTPGAGRRSVRLESATNFIIWSNVTFTVAPVTAPVT
jgi:hypothetical protein